MMTKLAARRAARGAAFLDQKDQTWFEKVDPAKLHMGSNRDCVLGQVYGEFTHGLRESGLRGSTWEAIRFGFFVGFLPGVSFRLREAWKREIASRRALARAV